MRRGLDITHSLFDEVRLLSPVALRAIAPALAPLATVRLSSLLARRDRLVADIAQRYGLVLYPHPRRAHVVVVAASDMDRLHAAVMHDRLLSAVGRGYFLGLGGELDVVSAPDWTCDHRRVALLRTRVLLFDHWLRPTLRTLVNLGRDGLTGLRPWLIITAASLALGSTVAIAVVAAAIGGTGAR